jgi:hypothetical protein
VTIWYGHAIAFACGSIATGRYRPARHSRGGVELDIIKGACSKPEDRGILGWVTFTANQHVRKMGKKVLLAVVTGASLLNFSAGALDQSAPFGFSWGPVDKVPRPSLATRDENITRLTYFRDRLPPNFRNTEEIVLEVCKNEGLQQIIWISRLLSETEERDRVQAILAEGMRRYGEAEISEQGVVNWSAGRTVMARTSDEQGLHRIIMVSTGPGYDTCSQEHGHPLSDHWMQFLPNHGAR